MKTKDKRKNIFVVEDDTDISELMEIVITRIGYEVEVFSNTDKLEDSMQTTKPDLVVMDLSIGRVDGSNLVKKFKKNKKISDIPIVLISAKNSLGDIAKSVKADGYLAKPFNIGDLESIVRKFT